MSDEITINIIEEDTINVEVIEEIEVIEVEVSDIGVQGPKGEDGGVLQPIAFTNQTSFTHVHNLGRLVDVSILSAAGNIIIGDVQQDMINNNYVTITFSSATTGILLIK